MAEFDIALFDLDGTVLYTLDDLHISANFALRQFGFPERTLAEVKAFVGNGMRKLIERSVPAGTSEDTVSKVLECFNAHYKVHCTDNTRVYDGVIDMLKSLRKSGIKTALVSNKSDYGVQILSKQYFDGLFDFSLGYKEEIEKKPSPSGVLYVLDKLKISIDRAIYIGDSDVDVETARNAKIPCISVTWGFRSKEFIRRFSPDYTVDTPNEIIKIIKG